MKKLKAAIITPYGAEERLDRYAEFLLAKGLHKLGHEVHFYTYKIKSNPKYRRNSVYQGIPVFRCRQRAGIAPGLIFSILRFKPDAVLYFHPKSYLSFSAWIAGRITGAKIISEIVGILHDPFIVSDTDNPIETIRSDVRLYPSWKGFIRHFPVARADIIVAITENERGYIKRFYGRDSAVIPWAVPKDAYLEQAKPNTNLPENFLLFIAQAKKRKGWDTVLEALAILGKENIKKNLVLVCPTADLEAFKDYASSLGIISQITFLSGITNPEKNWLFLNCRAVLAPSRYEGFGLPPLEAMRAGKPILGTTIPAYLEFLVHEKNALLSPPGDAKALAENIKRLDHDQALRQNLIEEGLKTADLYTEDAVVEKFLALINSIR